MPMTITIKQVALGCVVTLWKQVLAPVLRALARGYISASQGAGA